MIIDPSEDLRRAAIDVVAALPADSRLHELLKPALVTMIAHDDATEIVLAAATALCGDGNATAKLDGDALTRLRAVQAAAAKSKPKEISPTRRDALDAALRCVPDAAPPAIAAKKSRHER